MWCDYPQSSDMLSKIVLPIRREVTILNTQRWRRLLSMYNVIWQSSILRCDDEDCSHYMVWCDNHQSSNMMTTIVVTIWCDVTVLNPKTWWRRLLSAYEVIWQSLNSQIMMKIGLSIWCDVTILNPVIMTKIVLSIWCDVIVLNPPIWWRRWLSLYEVMWQSSILRHNDENWSLYMVWCDNLQSSDMMSKITLNT